MIKALSKVRTILGDRAKTPTGFTRRRRSGHHPVHPIEGRVPIPHDRTFYRQRHMIENVLGRLEVWQRIRARYDRCAHTSMSAICITATVILWL